MVVFPELSRPSTKMRASLSERLSLRRSVCARGWGRGDGVGMGVLSAAALVLGDRLRGDREREPRLSRRGGSAASAPAPRGRRSGGATSYRGARRSPLGAPRRLGNSNLMATSSGGPRGAGSRRSDVVSTASPGSAAPRARAGIHGAGALGCPAFDTEGARGAPSFPPVFLFLHTNNRPRSARRVGPAGMAQRPCTKAAGAGWPLAFGLRGAPARDAARWGSVERDLA